MIEQNNALIRGVFKVDPEKLSDSKWTKLASQAIWYLKFTGVLVRNNNKIN